MAKVRRTLVSQPSEETSTREIKEGVSDRLLYVKLSEIKPASDNPRKHSRQQIRGIATSIHAFGFNAPILIDRNKRIVAGHGRFEAAKLLGYSHIPAISLEHLNPDQARAYMLADNKLTDRSKWDEAKLAIHLKELSQLALDFEIEATGFEVPEIDILIQSLDGSDVDTADEFDPASDMAISRAGDLWILGDHRLLCGSALDETSYKTILHGEAAAAVFTDPPYNVRIQGHVTGNGAIRHREFAMASGEMNESEFTGFLTNTTQLLRAHSVDGAVLYICMDWRHMMEVHQAAGAADLQLINLCVWVKTNGGMGSFYRSKHELVFVFRNGSEQHRNNVELGRHGRNRNNVWHYNGANSFARRGQENRLELHPTIKPIALVADAILDCTKPNDIVLDPFLGSGTTLLAAERMKRRCVGIELDPLYVDTAIERWERLTGNQAKHVSGVTYRELRNVRRAGG
jgi:DNA modification methylase